MRVAEKVAIVTGGLSGIGVGVAARLARDGMIVVAADISTQSMALDRTLRIHPFRVDVADQNSVATLVQAVMTTCGRLDCLVHCAGIGRVLPFLETPLETFDLVLKTNLYGTFIVGQACARVMAGSWQRCHREYRQRFWPARQRRPRGIRRLEGRHRYADRSHGCGTGGARCSRQRYCPRSDRNASDGDAARRRR